MSSNCVYLGLKTNGLLLALMLVIMGNRPCYAQTALPQAAVNTPMTLANAIADALAVSPSARGAAEQLAQAQARVVQADAERRLAVTFNTTVGGSNATVTMPPPAHENFGTLQNVLTVPLPLGAKPRLAVAQAEAQLAAAQATYSGARTALASQVSATYFDLLRKQALLQIAQDTQTADERQLGEARRRNQAGDVPDLDVLRAQVPLAYAQASVGQAAVALTIAVQALNALTGREMDAPLSVAEVPPTATLLSYTLAQARTLAAQSSADIRAANATVQADEIALQNARHYADPALSLQVSDTRSNDQTSFRRLDTVQASVTFPLSDGGLGRGQVREAEAALAQAQVQAETARLTALTTVSAAYLTAQASQDQVSAAEVAQKIAQITYDKTLFGYQNGLFPFSDVLSALSALTQARIARTQAVYDTAVAVAGLSAAVRGFEPSSLSSPLAPPASSSTIPDVPPISAPGSTKTGTGAAANGEATP